MNLPEKISAKDVEVCVLTFNRCALLKQALESLAEQTADGFLVSVYDNASSDATPEVVEAAKKSFGENLKYVRHSENIGADANFHAALDGASRKYTMFMHDDDIAHPNYLEYAIEAINIFGNVALLASDYTCIKLPPIRRHNLITPKRRHSYSTIKKSLPHTYSATVELHTPQPYTARRICASLTAPISTGKSETLPS